MPSLVTNELIDYLSEFCADWVNPAALASHLNLRLDPYGWTTGEIPSRYTASGRPLVLCFRPDADWPATAMRAIQATRSDPRSTPPCPFQPP